MEEKEKKTNNELKIVLNQSLSPSKDYRLIKDSYQVTKQDKEIDVTSKGHVN